MGASAPRVPPGYISLADAAKRIGKDYTTLRRWWRTGLMPAPRQIGPNTIGFVEAEIIEWERTRPRVSRPKPTVSSEMVAFLRELKQAPQPRGEPMHYVSPTGRLIVRAIEVFQGEIAGIDIDADGAPLPRYIDRGIERRFIDNAGGEWTFEQLRRKDATAEGASGEDDNSVID